MLSIRFSAIKMSVVKSAHIAVVTVFLLVDSSYSAPPAFKLCGRQLVETMEGLCKEYNSPPWDVPTGKDKYIGYKSLIHKMGMNKSYFNGSTDIFIAALTQFDRMERI